jgi:hypothetical protein
MYSGQRIRKITTATGDITTIGGTGIAGFSGDGGAATAAQLNWPAYISFDADENMYIGDDQNYRVRKIAAGTGIISTIAGTGTGGYNGDGIAPTTAWLNHAYHPYFDKNNCSMLIADTYNHRIRKISNGFTGCLPAVAPGNKVACQVLPAITIDNTNNNSWVAIYDSAGRIAAEILANGNNLGIVTASLYTQNGPCREDANFRLYLNRNITIIPENQPASGNVSVRLYLLKAELDSLRTAMNSQNQPSGVAGINEVDVFKNIDDCLAVGGNTALPLSALPGTYSTDYYLELSIAGFSSFYFANKLLPVILPVKIKSFTGKHTGMEHQLKWEAACTGDVLFAVERSTDGIHFNTIKTIAATPADWSRPFYFTDKNILTGNNYYRLRIVEQNNPVSYSTMLLLNNKRPINIVLLNTLVTTSELNIEVFSETANPVKLICTDLSGRTVLSTYINLFPGNSRQVLDTRKLSKGIYWIYAVGKEGSSNVIKFIK